MTKVNDALGVQMSREHKPKCVTSGGNLHFGWWWQLGKN